MAIVACHSAAQTVPHHHCHQHHHWHHACHRHNHHLHHHRHRHHLGLYEEADVVKFLYQHANHTASQNNYHDDVHDHGHDHGHHHHHHHEQGGRSGQMFIPECHSDSARSTKCHCFHFKDHAFSYHC